MYFSSSTYLLVVELGEASSHQPNSGNLGHGSTGCGPKPMVS